MTEEKTDNYNEIFTPLLTNMRLLKKGFPIDTFISSLKTAPSSIRRRIVRYLGNDYGNAPITEYVLNELNLQNENPKRLLDDDMKANIKAYLEANKVNPNSLIVPDSVSIEYIGDEEQFMACLPEIIKHDEFAVHGLSSIITQDETPSILQIGTLDKIWIVDITLLTANNLNRNSLHRMYQMILDHSSAIVYLQKSKHFENIQKALPTVTSFFSDQNAIDIYDYIHTLYHLDMSQFKLPSLLYIFFGCLLDEHQSRSDWNYRPLSFFQLHYASSLVFALISIYDFMKKHPTWENAGPLCQQRYEEVLYNKNKVPLHSSTSKSTIEPLNNDNSNENNDLLIFEDFFTNETKSSDMNLTTIANDTDKTGRVSLFTSKQSIFDPTNTEEYLEEQMNVKKNKKKKEETNIIHKVKPKTLFSSSLLVQFKYAYPGRFKLQNPNQEDTFEKYNKKDVQQKSIQLPAKGHKSGKKNQQQVNNPQNKKKQKNQPNSQTEPKQIPVQNRQRNKNKKHTNQNVPKASILQVNPHVSSNNTSMKSEGNKKKRSRQRGRNKSKASTQNN